MIRQIVDAQSLNCSKPEKFQVQMSSSSASPQCDIWNTPHGDHVHAGRGGVDPTKTHVPPPSSPPTGDLQCYIQTHQTLSAISDQIFYAGQEKKPVCLVRHSMVQVHVHSHRTYTSCSITANNSNFPLRNPQRPTTGSWLNHAQSLEMFDIKLFKMIHSRTTIVHGVQNRPHWLI